ncbi:DUF2891 domain-containing protein [Natronolimnobius sp. AArcel1]|uniref:DUF2891 domain-containing protein n=1 Tax=Natronolimnobius sp. AArcel1 TaxID=1679093 RepID=UPI0013E9EC3E|nr:DUF2891 domain-containing protein [Natronolimnobius sp. AArcel1]NGM68381.1 DUF2891 domain-containing protein [Natronolimnobius sp. AArcel1]
MNPLTTPPTERVLSGTAEWLGADEANWLARHPLESIETEYPHHVWSVDSPEGVDRPSDTHPVFYGCYDWHSAVHSHWALVRQLRLVDDHPLSAEITESIDSRLTSENVAQEVTHLEENPSFEKPYGWAWLLHLAAELEVWDDPRADRWGSTLEPLERTVAQLLESEFLTQERPFRVGTHGNSAFALHCALDYARTTGDDDLASAVTDTAREWFGDDRDYPVAYEPLGWDFLSPALTEADLMRRIYDRDAFVTWFDGFVPDLTSAPANGILEPVATDPEPDEEVATHLIGLNLAKAWCLAGLASTLEDHRYVPALEQSAAKHAQSGLSHAFTDDYAGAHWLSSFALYLLTRNEGTIAPTTH